MNVDIAAAIDRLMRFLAIEAVTGREKAIGKEVEKALIEAGVPKKAVRYDDAHTRIPMPSQTGNLIVKLAGTAPGPRRLFMSHLDTVPLCAGAVPVRKGKKIVPAGNTALGGDNRTGVAVLVTLAAELLKHQPAFPPLTLLFTVREESGLYGARYLDLADLGGPALGFNFDGKTASELTIGAVGAERWEVEIFGRASHAGVHPEQGISSTAVASVALARVVRGGWFGKVVQSGLEGTSNVGSFGGADGASAGVATNVVTDYVHIRGESRSHDPKFVRAITAAYKEAFEAAAKELPNSTGKTAKVKFRSQLDYHPFRLQPDDPAVVLAETASRRLGLDPVQRLTNGGLDANWLVKHGVPTVTLGAGQNEIHTVNEWVDLTEFGHACRLAYALATEGV